MDAIAHPAFSKGLGSFLPPSVTALWPIIRVPPQRLLSEDRSLIYIVFTDAESHVNLRASKNPNQIRV